MMNVRALTALSLPIILTLACTGCGGSGGTSPTSSAATSTPTSTATSNAYATAYHQAGWASNTSITFVGTCTMEFTSTGIPPFHDTYYLGPGSGTAVAYTAVTKTPLVFVAYSASSASAQSVTVNACPTKAATTTATTGGPIGYTISGEALFDPYEADASTPALEDNASATAPDGSTAYFIDPCNSHSNGSTWHYHAVPSCLTASLDGTSGPSHLIGFALDGFPIYGGRDINGNVISVSQLDACNGITSPTPEFPNGAYHYVLPIGVTGKQSSLTCYSGTVTQAALAAAGTRLCGRAYRRISSRPNAVKHNRAV
jgi:hypothetical protein